MRALPLALALAVALRGQGLASRAAFRSSLTATVAAAPAASCREVALRWAPRAGAARYEVAAAPEAGGPWRRLGTGPPGPCGPPVADGPTRLLDRRPPGAGRLHYRVSAFGAGPRAIDSTDAVPVVVR